MDLEPDDDLPVASGTADELFRVYRAGDNVHGTRPYRAWDTLVYLVTTTYTE
jgi:hypothetical protein